MNHVLTNPEDYYSQFFKTNVTKHWKDRLKKFFDLPETIAILRKENYSKLYENFYNTFETDSNSSDLTRVLVGAGIDFITKIDTIPLYCFMGMPHITKIIIPKNIKAIPWNAFSGLANNCVVEYAGTVSELNKLIDERKYFFKKEFVSKVICSDGEVEIE